MRLQKRNGLVIASVSGAPTSSPSKNLYAADASETIKDGFRPSDKDAVMTAVSHCGDVASVLIRPNGKISVFGTIVTGHHYLWHGIWPVA